MSSDLSCQFYPASNSSRATLVCGKKEDSKRKASETNKKSPYGSTVTTEQKAFLTLLLTFKYLNPIFWATSCGVAEKIEEAVACVTPPEATPLQECGSGGKVNLVLNIEYTEDVKPYSEQELIYIETARQIAENVLSRMIKGDPVNLTIKAVVKPKEENHEEYLAEEYSYDFESCKDWKINGEVKIIKQDIRLLLQSLVALAFSSSLFTDSLPIAEFKEITKLEKDEEALAELISFCTDAIADHGNFRAKVDFSNDSSLKAQWDWVHERILCGNYFEIPGIYELSLGKQYVKRAMENTYVNQKYDLAYQDYIKAIALFKVVAEGENYDEDIITDARLYLVRAFNLAGSCAKFMNNSELARENYLNAIKYSEKFINLGLIKEELFDTAANCAEALAGLSSSTEEEIDFLYEAIRWRKLYLEKFPGAVENFIRIGDFYRKIGDLKVACDCRGGIESAVEDYLMAVQYYQKTLENWGPDHVNYPCLLSEIGYRYERIAEIVKNYENDNQTAKTYYLEAIRWYEEFLNFYPDLANLPQSANFSSRCSIENEIRDITIFRLPELYRNVAEIERNEKNFEKAIDYLLKTINWRKRSLELFPEDAFAPWVVWEMARDYLKIATIYYENLSDGAKAKEHLNKAIETLTYIKENYPDSEEASWTSQEIQKICKEWKDKIDLSEACES